MSREYDDPARRFRGPRRESTARLLHRPVRLRPPPLGMRLLSAYIKAWAAASGVAAEHLAGNRPHRNDPRWRCTRRDEYMIVQPAAKLSTILIEVAK
jgi:hypothetical protein